MSTTRWYPWVGVRAMTSQAIKLPTSIVYSNFKANTAALIEKEIICEVFAKKYHSLVKLQNISVITSITAW